MQTTKLSMPQGVYAPNAFSTTLAQAPFFSGWQYQTSGLKPMASKNLKPQLLHWADLK